MSCRRLANRTNYLCGHGINRTSYLTLPSDKNGPARGVESPNIFSIAVYVSLEFGPPEFGIGRRHGCEAAIGVAMPEAPMNEDGDAWPAQHDVWSTRQFLGVKPEA